MCLKIALPFKNVGSEIQLSLTNMTYVLIISIILLTIYFSI